jgi:hypothetical protein
VPGRKGLRPGILDTLLYTDLTAGWFHKERAPRHLKSPVSPALQTYSLAFGFNGKRGLALRVISLPGSVVAPSNSEAVALGAERP